MMMFAQFKGATNSRNLRHFDTLEGGRHRATKNALEYTTNLLNTLKISVYDTVCIDFPVFKKRVTGLGASYKTAMAESYTVLEQLGMLAKMHSPVKALSGGMQRKLSLGIAFVMSPRLVTESACGHSYYIVNRYW